MKRFEAGSIDVFQHLQVDRVRLEASRNAVRARTSELRASVALIRALGGGWTTSQNSISR
jgi:outer membrane protein, multidrug efflux system